MSTFMMIFLIVGVPLIIMAIGFIVLVTKVFGNSDGRAERAQTLETARQLERTLTTLEKRLEALENIVISGRHSASAGNASRPD